MSQDSPARPPSGHHFQRIAGFPSFEQFTNPAQQRERNPSRGDLIIEFLLERARQQEQQRRRQRADSSSQGSLNREERFEQAERLLARNEAQPRPIIPRRRREEQRILVREREDQHLLRRLRRNEQERQRLLRRLPNLRSYQQMTLLQLLAVERRTRRRRLNRIVMTEESYTSPDSVEPAGNQAFNFRVESE